MCAKPEGPGFTYQTVSGIWQKGAKNLRRCKQAENFNLPASPWAIKSKKNAKIK